MGLCDCDLIAGVVTAVSSRVDIQKGGKQAGERCG